MRVPVLLKEYSTPTITIHAGTRGVFSEGAWWFDATMAFDAYQIDRWKEWFEWRDDNVGYLLVFDAVGKSRRLPISELYDLLEAEKESRGIR